MPYLFLLIIVVLVACVAIFNRLVRLRNQVDESWSDIDVQLKRRYDLIPNLVETVKGYAAHEKDTFEQVTQARTQAIAATGVDQKAQAEGVLTGALKTLFAVAENYPQLKANENFLDLQKNLTDIENNIQLARRYYNAVVRDYNIAIQSFPSMIFASMFNFQKKDFFGIDQGERENVQVKF